MAQNKVYDKAFKKYFDLLAARDTDEAEAAKGLQNVKDRIEECKRQKDNAVREENETAYKEADTSIEYYQERINFLNDKMKALHERPLIDEASLGNQVKELDAEMERIRNDGEKVLKEKAHELVKQAAEIQIECYKLHVAKVNYLTMLGKRTSVFDKLTAKNEDYSSKLITDILDMGDDKDSEIWDADTLAAFHSACNAEDKKWQK